MDFNLEDDPEDIDSVITATITTQKTEDKPVLQIDVMPSCDNTVHVGGERCLLLAVFERALLDLTLDDRSNRRKAFCWLFNPNSNPAIPWSAAWCASMVSIPLVKFREEAKLRMSKLQDRKQWFQEQLAMLQASVSHDKQ